MSYLTDGFSTTVTFYALGTGVTLYAKETSVTPPGINAGGENDTTTMRNTTWRTRQPKSLKTLTNATCTFQYDPAIYDQILTILGTNGSILLTFSDSSTLFFYGWLDDFTPGECVEGAMPTATGTIICSNQNAAGDETAPVYSAA